MPGPAPVGQPIFYYDLGDPESYLVAERVISELPVVPEWEPVLGAQLGLGFPRDVERIERRAVELGLQPVRWPVGWPPDSRQAMLAATYAKGIGRAVAFSLAAFRQEFAGGRDLEDRDTILIAGAACEMHPTALLKGIGLRSVTETLTRATSQAQAAGVGALPAIRVQDAVFAGEDALPAAAAALLAQTIG